MFYSLAPFNLLCGIPALSRKKVPLLIAILTRRAIKIRTAKAPVFLLIRSIQIWLCLYAKRQLNNILTAQGLFTSLGEPIGRPMISPQQRLERTTNRT